MLGKANVGAGTSLSFKITIYSEDTDLTNITGSENEIAILTDISMNNWYIQSNLIDSPLPGDLVILTSQFSAAPINIIKKGEIEVYPINVQQYDGTDWLEKDCYIWSQGQWVNIRIWLFNQGINQNLWEINTSAYGMDYSYAGSAKVTINKTIHLQPSNGCWSIGCASTKNKIDLTNFTQIRITVSSGTLNAQNGRVGFSSNNTGVIQACAVFGLPGVGTYTFDIGQISSEWYIILGAGNHCNGYGEANFNISKVELLP